MQGKDEKISGMMADDNKSLNNVDSLINKLIVEMAKESKDDIRNQTIQSTSHRHELTNEDGHDIDKEITELETLIKRLQAEIVEMSETANKPPSQCPDISVCDESSATYNGASYASPEISKVEKPASDTGKPIISKDDGILEQHVKMFAENISHTINVSNSKNADKDALDNVRRNLNELWDNPTKSSKGNLDLNEKPAETLSSKLSTAFKFCIMPSSLETNNPMIIDNVSIEPVKSISDNDQVEQNKNVSEFPEGVSPNYEHTLNDICDDEKKINTDNKLSEDSTDNGDISGNVTEAVADNIISNVNYVNAQTSRNLPGSTENYSNTTTSIPKDTIINVPKPESVEAIKTKIIKTLQNVTSSDNTGFSEPDQVAPPTGTPEIMETLSATHENIPKTDSIFKSFNKKIRKIVGRGSEKSLSKEKHKSEDWSDKDLSKESPKAFPRSKSEPNKNFYTTDDDSSSIIESINTISLSKDSSKTDIKGVSYKINTNNDLETSNIKVAENSNEIISIVKKMIPIFVSNDLIIDKSECVTENPPDTTTTTTESNSPSQNFIKLNLTNTVYEEMASNGPKPINIANEYDNPTPDISKMDPEEDQDTSESITAAITSAFPQFFGTNIKKELTNQIQENVPKAEMKTVEIKAEAEKVQLKGIQETKVEEDIEAEEIAEEEDVDDEQEEDDEEEDDDDDDDNAYDVD